MEAFWEVAMTKSQHFARMAVIVGCPCREVRLSSHTPHRGRSRARS